MAEGEERVLGLAPELLLYLRRFAQSADAKAVVLDFDGTLVPIADSPHEVSVPDELRANLRNLCRRCSLVVIASGRPVSQLQKLIRLKEVVYVGDHGWEVHKEGQIAREVSPEVGEWYRKLSGQVRNSGILQGLPGVLVEEKFPTIAVHFRKTPSEQWDRVREEVEKLALSYGGRVQPGKRVWELQHPTSPNKASAILPLLEEQSIKDLIYIGDDYTDLLAFREISRWRGMKALRIGVASSEMPAELPLEADFMLKEQGDVARVLSLVLAPG